MRELEIIVDKTGKVTIETIGFVGSSCEDVSKQIAKALGEVSNVEHKSEYFEQEVINRGEIQGTN